MNLNGMIGHSSHELRTVELCHGRFLLKRSFMISKPAGFVKQISAALDFKGAIGNLKCNRLEFTDRLTKLNPLF